jgi:nucleoside-diphosphate-sugar epimerase
VRILVTGAHGFIGSHLIPELDHEVIGTDRDHADLAIPGVARALVEGTHPEYVVHLAARYGRILCRDEPHRAVSDNAAATTELAAVCAERDIPVLYASSSEVYGDHGTLVITEDSPLLTPTTIYGLSKRWGEEALSLYLPSNRLTIVRLNMLYGPEQRAGYGCCALATFIDKALKEEPFTVHRGTSRSWLYITDAVRALAQLIDGRHTGIYNLGNSLERMRMEDIAEEVVEACGGSYEITEPPEGQIPHKNYSVEKLHETIDWEPQVRLTEGIQRTVEWAQHHDFRDYAVAA